MTRANVTCTMVGMDKLEVESSHHIKVVMDCLCDENIETYDALVIPGGLPGATNLRDDKRVIDLVQKFNNANKIVAAICAGLIVLEKAGVIKDKKVTCFPGFEKELNSAIYQDTLVLSRWKYNYWKRSCSIIAFSYCILEALGIDSSNIQEGMQYKFLKKNI